MTNRFDLEQSILNAWHVVDDIELIYHKADQLSQDDLQNSLLGLMTIYKLRFEKLFETYEDCISNENQRL